MNNGGLVDVSEIDESSAMMTKNEERLYAVSPIKITLKLSIGPLLFSTLLTLSDSLDLFFVGRRFSNEGVTIVSISSLLRSVIFVTGNFFMQGTTVKISESIPKRKKENAGQLCVDMLRTTLFLAIVFPAILIPLQDYILKWMGIASTQMKDAKDYLTPCYTMMTFNCFFGILCFVLMGEGKATLAASIQISSLVVTFLIIDPLVIFVLKAPLWAVGVAFNSGPSVAALFLIYYFLSGRSSVKPHHSMFFKKFSHDYGSTIKLSIPTILNNVCSMLTPMVLSSILSKMSEEIQVPILPAIATTTSKPLSMVTMTMQSGVSGLLPSGTYAFHKGDYARVRKLASSSIVLLETIVLCISPLMIFKPELVWGRNNDLGEENYPSIFLRFSSLADVRGFCGGHFNYWISIHHDDHLGKEVRKHFCKLCKLKKMDKSELYLKNLNVSNGLFSGQPSIFYVASYVCYFHCNMTSLIFLIILQFFEII